MFTNRSKLLLIVLLLPMGCASPILLLLPARTSENKPRPMVSSTQVLPTPEIDWKIFHSTAHGFSFAYPSVYDEPQYQACAPKVVVRPDGMEFSIGHQSFLNVQQVGDLNVQTYVDDLVTQKQAEEVWILESQSIGMVGGEEAIEINYRFGGTNRFGTATFLSHNDLLFTFNFYAGVFCDIPEKNLTEGQVYAQWIGSLQFDE